MTLTPEQIEGASFSTERRGGYRTEEVHRFLRTVADELRSLATRLRSAEGVNEDLQAASNEMAALMKDVHAQLGEKRRVAEIEIEELKKNAEVEAAAIITTATEHAENIKAQADRVLSDAEHHAELLRSDGEQRVREQAQQTLRAARAELQELLRQKHEIQHALAAVKNGLIAMHENLGDTALSPEALDDSIISQTLIDLREAQAPPPPPPPPPRPDTSAAPPPTPREPTRAEAPPPDTAPATPLEDPPAFGDQPPPRSDPSASHPAGTGTFFSPPDTNEGQA